jgi:hypothetical protein
MVRMATELVLLGTAGAPLPVPGRAGISSALVVDGRVFVVDCGRGTPGWGSAAAPPQAGTGCAGYCTARSDDDGGRRPSAAETVPE